MRMSFVPPTDTIAPEFCALNLRLLVATTCDGGRGHERASWDTLACKQRRVMAWQESYAMLRHIPLPGGLAQRAPPRQPRTSRAGCSTCMRKM